MLQARPSWLRFAVQVEFLQNLAFGARIVLDLAWVSALLGRLHIG